MKVRTWAAIAAASAATGLGAAPAVAQEQTGGRNQAGQDQGTRPDATVRTFLRASARSNLFEIRSSELVVDRARSADTRRLARILIRHHTAMQAMLAEVVQAQGVGVPTTLNARQRADLRRIQRSSRAELDRTYLRIQVQAHQLAVRLHLTAALAELPAPVRALAIEALPVIGDHLGRASELLRRAGGSNQDFGDDAGSGSGA